jgi:hypothetical protein
VTPTGPPIGGGGVPAGGIPGTPTKSGTPRIGQNSLFPGTPPSTPGFDARDPQIWSNSRFPGFTYVGTPPAGGGGTPRRPRKPPPIGIACRLTRAILLCLGGTRYPGGRHRNVLRISGKKHEISAGFGVEFPVNYLMFWVLNSACRNVLNSG